MPSRRLEMLQAGRGIAALLVVLYHSTLLFGSAKYWHQSVLGGAFLFGYSGVDFFFVLSGFIIAYAHGRDIGHIDRLPNYVWKRFSRVYPLYWIATCAAIATLLATGHPVAGSIVSNIMLVGASTDAALAVAWTLFHEVAFYAAFAVMIAFPRVGAGLLAAWFAVCLIGIGTTPTHYLLSPINILFAFGVATYFLTKNRSPSPVLLPIGAVLFLVIGLLVDAGHIDPMASHLAFGAAAAVGMAGAISAERLGVRPVAALRSLGDASFAVYLVHYPLLAALTKALYRFHISVLVGFIVMVAVALTAGLLVRRILERPLALFMRKLDATGGDRQPASL